MSSQDSKEKAPLDDQQSPNGGSREPLDDGTLVMPDGTPIENDAENQREKDRQSEDDDYVSVIIKRTDETRRHPDDALHHAIEEGLEQINRPALSLLLSAIAAGMIVGFSAMAVAVVLTALGEVDASELIRRIGTAFVYPLGFVVCILSGAQLFTEHTATAFYPVLDRKASFGQLFRLWGIVTFLIGIGGLHHSIAGSAEMFTAMFLRG